MQVGRRATTAPEDGDTVADGHRFGLVVGHVDGRHLQFALEPLDFGPHPAPQRRIEVRERFVQQKHVGVPDDGPPQGDPLLLTARQRGRLLAEQVGDAERPGDVLDAVTNRLLREVGGHPEPESDVLPGSLVGVQRVVLEHHRDVARLRRAVADRLVPDADVAGARVLETRDTPEGRRLPTAGGPDQNEQLAARQRQ